MDENEPISFKRLLATTEFVGPDEAVERSAKLGDLPVVSGSLTFAYDLESDDEIDAEEDGETWRGSRPR